MTSYRGNPQLKPKNIRVEWTPEKILELKKCDEDIIYFIKNYCKIVSLDEGIIPFDLWDFQEELILMMRDNRFIIANQSRQSGKCEYKTNSINIRNKKTGISEKTTIGEFYDRIKSSKNKVSNM